MEKAELLRRSYERYRAGGVTCRKTSAFRQVGGNLNIKQLHLRVIFPFSLFSPITPSNVSSVKMRAESQASKFFLAACHW
jgi:hypothetical protein